MEPVYFECGSSVGRVTVQVQTKEQTLACYHVTRLCSRLEPLCNLNISDFGTPHWLCQKRQCGRQQCLLLSKDQTRRYFSNYRHEDQYYSTYENSCVLCSSVHNLQSEKSPNIVHFLSFLRESLHYKLGTWRKTRVFTRQTMSNVSHY